jgi:hypothetical protein
MVKGDIADFDEVKQMVDRFYFCAMKDDLLGACVFTTFIGWDAATS